MRLQSYNFFLRYANFGGRKMEKMEKKYAAHKYAVHRRYEIEAELSLLVGDVMDAAYFTS